MRQKNILAAMIGGGLMLTATAATAENWQPFFIIPNGVIMLDRDSVTRTRGHVSARLESTYPQPQRINRNGRIYTYEKAVDRVDIDCAAQVYKNVSRDLYGDGVQALSLNEADNPMVVTPNTPQAAVSTAFCR